MSLSNPERLGTVSQGFVAAESGESRAASDTQTVRCMALLAEIGVVAVEDYIGCKDGRALATARWYLFGCDSPFAAITSLDVDAVREKLVLRRMRTQRGWRSTVAKECAIADAWHNTWSIGEEAFDLPRRDRELEFTHNVL